MTENRNEVTSTELVWPGKRTEADRVILAFQTVETVNKPRIDQPRFDFGEWPANYPRDWKNKLIWGDNKYVMASLRLVGRAAPRSSSSVTPSVGGI